MRGEAFLRQVHQTGSRSRQSSPASRVSPRRYGAVEMAVASQINGHKEARRAAIVEGMPDHRLCVPKQREEPLNLGGTRRGRHGRLVEREGDAFQPLHCALGEPLGQLEHILAWALLRYREIGVYSLLGTRQCYQQRFLCIF